MKRLLDAIDRSALAKGLLQAMPVGVVVVDDDLRVVAANDATRQAFSVSANTLLSGGPGDILSCLHAMATHGGCGSSSHCSSCQLRLSAIEALDGAMVNQREVALSLRVEAGEEERVVLVTTAPFSFDGDGYALVLIQDVTELHRLRGIIPVCSSCKKVRRDDEAWEQIESFVTDRSHAQFSHSLCPTCAKKLYPELDDLE